MVSAEIYAAEFNMKTVIGHDCVFDFARQIETSMRASELEFMKRLKELLFNRTSLLEALTREQAEGRYENYARNLLYADPAGRFSVLALVWRKGQITPIHGHWTWCGFSVLQGELKEDQFRWDAARECAQFDRQVTCPPNSVEVSPAGLTDIHRLGNYSDATAISLHIYGVDASRVATHVNRVVDEQF